MNDERRTTSATDTELAGRVAPTPRYLVPIPSLGVPGPWQVGRVTFRTRTDGEALLAKHPPYESPDDAVARDVREILAAANNGSVAEVTGHAEPAEAVEAVRTALDALRLFQLSRRTTSTTAFGLPGDLYQSAIRYIRVDQRSTMGAQFRGDHAGWAFAQSDIDDWSQSAAFQFLSAALIDPGRSEGAHRAVVGLQLFNRAALEHRSGLKMVLLSSALEAWLLSRQRGSQAMRLARYIGWFGCGRHDGDLCGRNRPICPYLHLRPESSRDRKRLSRLRNLGNRFTPWRCSEWHRLTDWYDSRSEVVHGEVFAVEDRAAGNAEYWIAHYLAEPILEWLGEHEDSPIEDLESELNRIDDPPRWTEMLAALDARHPPATPPV